jgi:hypothetical protein
VEARGRGQRGENLEEVKAKRGSAGIRRVTPCLPERTSRLRNTLELRRYGDSIGSPREEPGEKQHEGIGRREAFLAFEEGKPL